MVMESKLPPDLVDAAERAGVKSSSRGDNE
jgi:hypothetical protein